MTRPYAGQILSRVRFFLLFHLLALTTFEWQYFVANRFGKDSGGVTLGLSLSIGTLSTVLVLGGLAYFGKSLAISRIPSILLVVNSLVSWGLVQSVDAWKSLENGVFLVAAVHAALNLLTLSIEVSAVQLRDDLRYPQIRIFGSLGYLAAAFVSQQWGGGLFPWIIVGAMGFTILPMLSSRLIIPITCTAVSYSSRAAPLVWLSLTAFILWSVSRGFEVLGPIYLRGAMDQGLLWLTVLIIAESLLLQWVDRWKSSLVIVGAAMTWAGVYGLFAYGLSPATACVALALAGFNCPAQVVLQTHVGKFFPGVPAAQASLSIAGAAGGFSASLFHLWISRQPGASILGFCMLQSLLAIPLLWFCMRMVFWTGKPPPHPLEVATIDNKSDADVSVSQAA